MRGSQPQSQSQLTSEERKKERSVPNYPDWTGDGSVLRGKGRTSSHSITRNITLTLHPLTLHPLTESSQVKLGQVKLNRKLSPPQSDPRGGECKLDRQNDGSLLCVQIKHGWLSRRRPSCARACVGTFVREESGVEWSRVRTRETDSPGGVDCFFHLYFCISNTEVLRTVNAQIRIKDGQCAVHRTPTTHKSENMLSFTRPPSR